MQGALRYGELVEGCRIAAMMREHAIRLLGHHHLSRPLRACPATRA